MKKYKAAVNCVPGLLRLLVMGDIADVSKMHAASIFRPIPKMEAVLTFEMRAIIHHTMQQPKNKVNTNNYPT
jgi:hypothetical protein